MVQVIHEHTREDKGSGMGFFLGIVLLIIVLVLLIQYGLPALRQSSTPQINVPGQIDVNVNQPQR